MKFVKRRLRFEDLERRQLLAAVDIPDNLTGAAGAVVSAPVNVDVATGIRAVEIRLSYNTTLLDLTPAAVTAGSVWSGVSDAQVTANVDDANGTVVVFISSSSELPNIAGSLVVLGFTIAGSAAAGSTAVLDLTKATLNEGQIPVSPVPVSGVDATDGLITVTANGGVADRISGFVYADTNVNNSPDTVEGIPGVVVTLRNTTTGVEIQRTTQANGSYEFLNVPAGSYLLVEQQPVAYIEGGTNQISVTLTAGQALPSQNFRELGLSPRFIYNRLLTTTVLPVGSVAWTNQIAQINRDAISGTTAAAPVSSTMAIVQPTPIVQASSLDSPAAELFSSTAAAEGEQSENLPSTLLVASDPSVIYANPMTDLKKDKPADAVDSIFAEQNLW